MLRVNVGCGDFPAAGWVNVDCYAGLTPDVVADLGDLPFGDDSVDRLYAGHVLEHVALDRLPVVLAELARVLKPGGVLMVVGPDLDRAEADWPEVVDEIKAGGGRWPGDAHLWDSREGITVDLLTAAGFNAQPLPIVDVSTEWPVTSRIGWQFAVECR